MNKFLVATSLLAYSCNFFGPAVVEAFRAQEETPIQLRDDEGLEMADITNKKDETPVAVDEDNDASLASQIDHEVSTFARTADLKRDRKIDEDKVKLIPCPILASLYRAGHLQPDEQTGAFTSDQLRQALQHTGTSFHNAFFQALGIAAYAHDDVHQNDRKFGPKNLFHMAQLFHFPPLLLNLFTMQPKDDCKILKGSLTTGGFPCNSNVQNQQHGFSTILRDSRHPNFEENFNDWIGGELTEGKTHGIPTEERVLLKQGLINILKRARDKDGDFSAEYSLNVERQYEGSNLQKYHPSITDENKRMALSVWQPLLAWSGFWTGFCRYSNETGYFTESDLKSFFIDGAFPTDWVPRQWGLKENTEFMLSLKGNGLGDEWLSIADGAHPYWSKRWYVESKYLLRLVKTFTLTLPIQADQKFNTCVAGPNNTCSEVRSVE
jgi:hypothetical protein